jgi:eukaryotic-like serine/threonine-protein kinase
MKCLEKDRDQRYDSAGALMRDIRRYIAGEAVQAVPPSTAYRLKKLVRRNKGPVVAGSLLAFALIAGLVGTSFGFFNAERQRKIAVTEKDRADENATKALAAEAIATRQAYSASMLSTLYRLRALGTKRFGSESEPPLRSRGRPDFCDVPHQPRFSGRGADNEPQARCP